MRGSAIERLRWVVCAAAAAFGAFVAHSSAPDDDVRALAGGQERAGWLVPTPGWSFEPRADQEKALVLSPHAEAVAVGNAMRWLEVERYRGKRVRYSAQVEVAQEPVGGYAQLWHRVDLTGGRHGAFDNMHDRPIRSGQARRVALEFEVDPEAVAVAIGCLSLGNATVALIGPTITVLGDAAPRQAPSPPSSLSAEGTARLRAGFELLALVRYFHPSDAARSVTNWDLVALAVVDAAESATSAGELASRLTAIFAPIAPGLEIRAENAPREEGVDPPTADAIRSYRHIGAGSIVAAQPGLPRAYRTEIVDERFDGAATPLVPTIERDLPGGVTLRLARAVPLVHGASMPGSEAPADWTAVSPPVLSARNRSTRLAGVGLAWGVFRHFYPYFEPNGPASRERFEAAFDAALRKAATDEDEASYLETLERFVASLDDGHGSVWSPSLPMAPMLPVALAWAGEDLVVVGVHPSAADVLSIGDAIEAIDGVDASTLDARARERISTATEGWSRARSPQVIVSRLATGDPAIVSIRKPDGSRLSAPLARVREPVSGDTAIRPADGTELAPGIVYFDLNGAEAAAFTALKDRLVAAKGIVFDLRGYPGQAAYLVLQHLIDQPVQSARWRIPIVTEPDGFQWTWQEPMRWHVQPLQPRFTAKVAWLTDGRAISYAESILGIVEAHRLGEIVGATTAGTNGNVNPFRVPPDFTLSWTGMQVLKHDGSPHHGVGIKPTVPVEPTQAGIAARRDEVLERAVETLSAAIAR